jgi:hypothetical protein
MNAYNFLTGQRRFIAHACGTLATARAAHPDGEPQ